MKKSYKLFALAILAGLAFSTSSCTKCQTCKHIDPSGNVLLTWEVCNDKNTMDQSKADCNAAADAWTGSECKCTVKFSF